MDIDRLDHLVLTVADLEATADSSPRGPGALPAAAPDAEASGPRAR